MFNGKEFGGKHPALILKNTGDSLIVVPLSSQSPASIKPYHVNFFSPYGSVKGHVLNDIKNAIEVAGIN